MTAWRAVRALLLAWLLLAVAPAHAAADLSIAMARSGNYMIGSQVSYALTVTNLGHGREAGTITIGGSVAAGLVPTGYRGDGWACSPGGTLGSCAYMAGLAAGARAPVLTVTLQPTTEGEKKLTATVSGSNDPNAANNSASDTATAYGPADLSIAIVRSGTFQVGRSVTYAVTVTNNGPYSEFGKITVGGTVAPGFNFTGVSGSGWTCTTGGALGTCAYGAGLASEASAPALTITVTVNTEGEKTVTATVSGNADPDSANNSTSNTGTALPKGPPPPPPAASYALTDRACSVGARFGSDDCQRYTAPATAGRATAIHVTALDAGAAAMAPPAATVALQFALRCVNPARPAGVKARVATAELPDCAPGGEAAPGATRWSGAVDVVFGAGQASTAIAFQYADVGQVELHLRQGGKAGTPGLFVSKPALLDLRRVSRGGVDAPAVAAPDGQAFAMAGETLLVEIRARVDDAGKVTYAPNFGNEAALPALALGRDPLYTDSSSSAWLRNAPQPLVDAASWKSAGGAMLVNASWSEVGATAFTVALSDYLGAGAVAGGRKQVGRFYPAYFSTEITAPFACGTVVACPAPPAEPVGLAYSRQPFNVRVVARNVQGQELGNFSGAWYRTINLSAVRADGAAAPGVLAPAQLTAPGSAASTHTLPNPYAALTHRAGNWSAPTVLRLRAQAQDGLDPKGVSSDRAPAPSDEAGLVVLSGRLRVAGALGTDVLRTPLALHVEYWSGTTWRGHPDYADATGAGATLARFSACTRTLAGSSTPCEPALVGVSALPANIALQQGRGVLWLRAPGKQANGRRRDGSVGVQFDGWTWLPSTLGRVSFGSHSSPLIYVREVY